MHTYTFTVAVSRFLRAGLTESAARECCRGLAEKDDERLNLLFHEALRRVSTSVPSSDDCAATVFLQPASEEAIIGEPIELLVHVRFAFDKSKVPADAWLGLYPAPSSIRRVLHDHEEHLTDFDLRSTPELGQVSPGFPPPLPPSSLQL